MKVNLHFYYWKRMSILASTVFVVFVCLFPFFFFRLHWFNSVPKSLAKRMEWNSMRSMFVYTESKGKDTNYFTFFHSVENVYSNVILSAICLVLERKVECYSFIPLKSSKIIKSRRLSKNQKNSTLEICCCHLATSSSWLMFLIFSPYVW